MTAIRPIPKVQLVAAADRLRCTAVVRSLSGYTRYGSVSASRFADGAAGLLSFELDCQAADIRENPVSAHCGRSFLVRPFDAFPFLACLLGPHAKAGLAWLWCLCSAVGVLR